MYGETEVTSNVNFRVPVSVLHGNEILVTVMTVVTVVTEVIEVTVVTVF